MSESGFTGFGDFQDWRVGVWGVPAPGSCGYDEGQVWREGRSGRGTVRRGSDERETARKCQNQDLRDLGIFRIGGLGCGEFLPRGAVGMMRGKYGGREEAAGGTVRRGSDERETARRCQNQDLRDLGIFRIGGFGCGGFLPRGAVGMMRGRYGEREEVAGHLPLTAAWGRIVEIGSGQALPRRPRDIAYRCCRQALAEFTSLRRVGPGRRRHSLGNWPLRLAEGRSSTPLWRVAGSGHRQLPV